METGSMRIAVLSGKGGTGKTLVSVNLAAASGKALYIDCDVEEPNGHLFFKPKNIQKEEITVPIPKIDPTLCSGCRACVDFCKFNALAYVRDNVIVFEEVCHSCGGCMLICPQKAITEREKSIGKIQKGVSGQVAVRTGVLNTGEATGIPIIKRLLFEIKSENKLPVFIDCPPGSACIVMESIKDADYCILVAEPTLFGVHNLSMVHELVKLFHKPYGAILNKCLDGENPSETFCEEQGIPILGRIPFDVELGALNSNAKIAAWEEGKYWVAFSYLLEAVTKEVRREATAYSQR